MNNRGRRSKLTRFFLRIRNICATIGGLGIVGITGLADSNDWTIIGWMLLITVVTFAAAAVVEKYVIQNLIENDICIDTLFTWDVYKSNLNITPYEHYKYKQWLKANRYADTEEAFELWCEE